jgi:hypothetical protein
MPGLLALSFPLPSHWTNDSWWSHETALLAMCCYYIQVLYVCGPVRNSGGEELIELLNHFFFFIIICIEFISSSQK